MDDGVVNKIMCPVEGAVPPILRKRHFKGMSALGVSTHHDLPRWQFTISSAYEVTSG